MPNSTSITLKGVHMLYRALPDESIVQIDMKNIEEIIFRKHEIVLLQKLGEDLKFITDYNTLLSAVSTISTEWCSNLVKEGCLKPCDGIHFDTLTKNIDRAGAERIKFHQNIINILCARMSHVTWELN